VLLISRQEKNPVHTSVSGVGFPWHANLVTEPPIAANMAGNFKGPHRPSPQFAHYENISLLGPPTMRGAIVFAGSSHPKLVEGICDRLGTKQGHATLGKFKNGETSVTIRMFGCWGVGFVFNTVQTHRFAIRMSSSSRAEARGWYLLLNAISR
jgi:hypothetical protein